MRYLTLLLLFLTATIQAQKQDVPPLDARLTGYDYGYPTDIFPLETQGKKMEMAYIDQRSEDWNGQTIVLLHGKNFNGAYWKTTIDLLLEEGYRVIAPDQIGFGKSTKPEDYQYTFQTLAENTRDLLNRLGVVRATVLGHSMGGMVATRFALMYPDRVSQLVLMNPIGLEDWKRKVPYRPYAWWYESELAKDYAGIKDYMQKSYYDGKWRAEYEPPVELLAGWAKGPDAELIARNSALTYGMIFTQPVVYEFDLLRVPTLLIIGTRDRTALGKGLVSAEVRETLGRYDQLGKTVADMIPEATLVELDNIGHLPHFEDFERFAKVLKDNLTVPEDPETMNKPELVAKTSEMQVTGITVASTGRTFLTFPRWRKGVEFTLAELVDGKPRAYPDQPTNNWVLGADAGAKLVNVQSAVAHGDTLYVADTRNPMFKGLISQPMVHLYDLRTNRKLRTYEISPRATTENTYVNDLRIDRKRGLVYFTDSGRGGIIVLDLQSGESWRHLDGHPSVQPEVDHLTIEGGKNWQGKIASDGIAIDPENDRLLYHALSGYTLYSVPLEKLAQRDTTKAAMAVVRLAVTPAPDGLWRYGQGTVMADLESRAVVWVGDDGSLKTLAKGAEVGWADTFSVHDGYLYFTNSKLPEAENGVQNMSFPVWRIRLE